VQSKERLFLAFAQRADLLIDSKLKLFQVCDIKTRSDKRLLGDNPNTRGMSLVAISPLGTCLPWHPVAATGLPDTQTCRAAKLLRHRHYRVRGCDARVA
jgi:hypothetical protein